MARIDLSLFRGSVLSIASQGVGVIQLLALLWRTGATNATDSYFYFFNLGLLPTQILIVGVLYPMLLSEDRITSVGVRRIRVTVPVLALLSVAAGIAWLHAAGRLTGPIVVIAAISALNAVVQALLWHRAILAAAIGQPEWEAAVALPANILATLVLLLPWPSSDWTVGVMVAALLIGNGGFLLAAVFRHVGDSAEVRTAASVGGSRKSSPYWFLGRSTASYGGLMVLQSLAVLLPPASLTLLSVAIKIVGSSAATFVNSVMPRLVHQGSASSKQGTRFLHVSIALIVPAVGVSLIITGVVLPRYLDVVAVVGLWLVAATLAATSQRLAFRFLPPSASRTTLVAVPTVVVLASVSATHGSFSLITLLCAYASVDVLVGTLLVVALRDRIATATGAIATSALTLIWIGTMVH